MNINTNHIKVSGRHLGKIEIEKPMQLGDACGVVVVGFIQDIQYSDNHDGTVEATYILRPTEARVEMAKDN
jgi:hypothetical protein